MSLVLARLDAELAVWLLALLVGFTVLAGLVLAEIRATEDDELLDQLAAGAEPQPGDELERWLAALRDDVRAGPPPT